MACDRASEESGDLARHYESACRENKRLQDDLITVTRENQVLHCELERSNGDKDSLREQLQDYISEVHRFEELLKQREQDRSGLLEQYRDLSNELNQMKVTLNGLEAESGNLKIENQMKHADNKRLRERLDTIERDFQQVFLNIYKITVRVFSLQNDVK
jgi:centrosomal protein CEP135